MINTNKIMEICHEKNLYMPALKQLMRAEQANSFDDVERIGNNIIEYLKERDWWRGSSVPLNRSSSSNNFPDRNTKI